ncbi:hypothetical protein [Glycomyces algeriensis]|uniref:SH3 domain-containing protein n=1 Tax=Glycomyces algeriensis TaxID=256037 RepID=A0A9W6LI62_9ACTN|nr:hypothetical protein [Glycomyces algeriensis]MDA1364620.1 hypothetical protein [Glycomyces algeriensis]MDR7350657.1 hypothetical protein [Glycomyces algeriensis]GLI43366.1 hypothetical protein GALLR39Z86_32160 [Glycomyces algeriensis]
MRILPLLSGTAVLLLAGCGTVADAVTGTRDYWGQTTAVSAAWEEPPSNVDAEGRRLDEPTLEPVVEGSVFEVVCALRVGETAYYQTRTTTADGWSDEVSESWVYAEGVQVKPEGEDEEYGDAGAVPDDVAECDVDLPETVSEPEAPDVHHQAYVVAYESSLYFSLPDTTFNGMSNGDYESVRLPSHAEIDVHCVWTTMNVVEEPPSTSYNEEVPYYLVTQGDHTGYVDPLWVYFADDPAEVPSELDYDAQTGTVADHGNVPELAECPAD